MTALGEGAAARRESQPPQSAPVHLKESALGAAEGFLALDAWVQDAGASGLCLAEANSANAARAIAAHVERRGRLIGRTSVVCAHADRDDGWLDLALRLGLDALDPEPRPAAGQLAQAIEQGGALIVLAPLAAQSEHGDELLGELARRLGRGSMLVIGAAGELPQVEAQRVIRLRSTLERAELSCWFQCLAEAQHAAGDVNFELLAAPSVPPSPRTLDSDALRALRLLNAARFDFPEAAMAELTSPAQLAELEARGFLRRADGLIGLGHYDTSLACSMEEAQTIAGLLERCFPTSAKALCRASELWATAHALDAATRAARRALSVAADASLRGELWRRLERAVEPLAPPMDRRLQAAELALELGDLDVAVRWAERATQGSATVASLLILGRAAAARGDLVAAQAALEQAERLGTDDPAVLVEQAEVHYASGEFARARELSSRVLASSPPEPIRLGARNVLGKILIADGSFREADAHFARDACDAVAADNSRAELRAHVNRAIALLSGDDPQSAERLLEHVRDVAKERGDTRALAFALTNLAVLATECGAYARALELSHEALVFQRRRGDRLGFARSLQNLAELRIRLGLFDEADQALRFAQNALGPGAPGSHACGLAVARARIHLERGNTLAAEREVRSAQRLAERATNPDKLSECLCLAARIALENGLVDRARQELERAGELALDVVTQAEVALLQALLARACGQAGSAHVMQALALAHEAQNDELYREALLVAAEGALLDGDDSAASEHLARATKLRDQLVADLPANIAQSFLQQRTSQRLAELERALSNSEPAPSTVRPEPRSRSARSEELVGRHPRVRVLVDAARRVAKSSATVMVLGESGTGKELVAELIHQASTRAGGPLVKVNCAALVESLLLSELFGHEKGAFTGAGARKRGRFERAHGGTLFLDEIGDISPRTQVALLRVLEERVIERVGGGDPIEVDVRIVCATHRDLRALVAAGQFREDLFFRLCGITLEVPALRERLADLPLLAQTLLERIALERGEEPRRLTPAALELLCSHSWPGNVRELENALSAASLFAEGTHLDVTDFTGHIQALKASQRRAAELTTPQPALANPAELTPQVAYREIRNGDLSLAELKRRIERECIARALEESGGSITRAAELLGMKRPRVSQLVKQYGFSRSEGQK